MPAGNLSRAIQAVADLKLNGANTKVAGHWLSRWRDDAPCAMGMFRQRDIWEHAPGLAYFEIHRGDSLRCLRAGSFHKVALGYEMSGKDIMSMTPEEQRAGRLDWCWKISQGAVTVSYRTYASVEGTTGLAQCVSLPFISSEPDVGYFIMHSNWRPVNSDWIVGNVQGDTHVPDERHMISFIDAAAAKAA